VRILHRGESTFFVFEYLEEVYCGSLAGCASKSVYLFLGNEAGQSYNAAKSIKSLKKLAVVTFLAVQ
jgi:hypothetical protein